MRGSRWGVIACWPTESNMLAAVNFDLRSVDIGCRATAKEIDRRGDFLDIPKTVQGYVVDHFVGGG